MGLIGFKNEAVLLNMQSGVGKHKAGPPDFLPFFSGLHNKKYKKYIKEHIFDINVISRTKLNRVLRLIYI